MNSKTFVILKHEFKKIAATKTFIITTILGPFLLAAMILLPHFCPSVQVTGAERLLIWEYIFPSLTMLML